MALRSKRICSYPGCLKSTDAARCEKHPYDRQKDTRPNASERMYTSEWAKASRRFRKMFPLCMACKIRGRVEPATCVDHIIPHKGDYGYFWDVENWQSLCWSCHNKKTQNERRQANSG